MQDKLDFNVFLQNLDKAKDNVKQENILIKFLPNWYLQLNRSFSRSMCVSPARTIMNNVNALSD